MNFYGFEVGDVVIVDLYKDDNYNGDEFVGIVREISDNHAEIALVEVGDEIYFQADKDSVGRIREAQENWVKVYDDDKGYYYDGPYYY